MIEKQKKLEQDKNKRIFTVLNKIKNPIQYKEPKK
jgi:hypothetical protein